MIHLDTNILIDFVNYNTPANPALADRLRQRGMVACSAVAWSEFCNGPCTKQQQLDIQTILENNIHPFDKNQAELAAHLYIQTGRRRSSRADCMIAAAAIHNNAPIATYNLKDFERFTPHGLKIEAITAMAE